VGGADLHQGQDYESDFRLPLFGNVGWRERTVEVAAPALMLKIDLSMPCVLVLGLWVKASARENR